MTDGDSDAWRRTDGTTTRRLWAQGVRTMLAGSRELAHASEETMRSTIPRYGSRRDPDVAAVAPHGAAALEESSPMPSDDAFDAFLATFEPDLPLTH